VEGIIDEVISKDSSFYSRYLIGKARHVMHKARQKELAPYHLSPQQVQILFNLYILHKTTLAELARYSNRGINTLSDQMTMLEKGGLVKKVRETPKSTLLSFELTEKGLNTYNHTNERKKADKEIMSVLSEEERQQLISLLKKVIDKAEEYDSTKSA